MKNDYQPYWNRLPLKTSNNTVITDTGCNIVLLLIHVFLSPQVDKNYCLFFTSPMELSRKIVENDPRNQDVDGQSSRRS